MGIDIAIIRAIHVLGVVVWIGGVAFVTTVILPGSSSSAHQRLQLFRRIKDRFAWQARAAVVAVGASGFWIVRQLRLWDRFADPRLWWMHAMVGLWAVFALMLFVAPLVARQPQRLDGEPQKILLRLTIVHGVLLVLSVLTLMGAVAGAHGL